MQTPPAKGHHSCARRANKTLLTKGAPEGQEQGYGMKLGEDRIELALVSGRYVRVHDAIFRLRKQLAEAWERNTRSGFAESRLNPLSFRCRLNTSSER